MEERNEGWRDGEKEAGKEIGRDGGKRDVRASRFCKHIKPCRLHFLRP